MLDRKLTRSRGRVTIRRRVVAVIRAAVNFRSSIYRSLRRELALVTLAFEQLEIAGRALEGRETPRPPAAALQPPASVHRCDCSRGSDQPSEEECPQPTTPLATVHARILRSR